MDVSSVVCGGACRGERQAVVVSDIKALVAAGSTNS
jgi:hypothetical protein